MLWNFWMKRFFCGVVLLLLSACASQQTKVNQVKQAFAQGNLPAAANGMDQAISSKNNIYNLEQGNIYRLMGTSKIPESTKQFLMADDILRQNEFKRAGVKSSLSSLGGYLLAEGLGKEYELKPYEGSLLAYSLALNHVLLADWDNARVEVMKMVKREQDVASFNEAKYQALEEQRKKGVSGSGSIDNRLVQGNPIINGYPVNTISNPETLALKNSYQSATAHYLAAFIFEKLREPSLAAPGYRLAIELRPDVPFLQEGLKNLDANINKPITTGPKGTTDTLFIVETGFLPFIDNFKVNIPIPISGQIRFATVSYPYIAPNTERYNPGQIAIDGQLNNLSMVTNIDTMVRRDLHDEMPAYMLRAASRAITQVLAQVGAQRAVQGNNPNNSNQANLGAIAGLITGITMGEASTADVRHWSNLPANIFMARAQVPNGTRDFLIRAQNGNFVGRQLAFNGDKTIVYVRVFRDRATIMASNDNQAGGPSIAQPIPFVLKNAQALPVIPSNNVPGQPDTNLKR
jgi:hypothetical protein